MRFFFFSSSLCDIEIPRRFPYNVCFGQPFCVQPTNQRNKHTNAHERTNKRTNKQTHEPTNQQTNSQTNKHTNKATNKQAHKQTQREDPCLLKTLFHIICCEERRRFPLTAKSGFWQLPLIENCLLGRVEKKQKKPRVLKKRTFACSPAH